MDGRDNRADIKDVALQVFSCFPKWSNGYRLPPQQARVPSFGVSKVKEYLFVVPVQRQYFFHPSQKEERSD